MGKKNAIKVRFNITLKSAFNLGAESDGKPYSIAWKRGSKSKNRGQTKKTEAKGGIVTFGETFTLVATMLQDEKSKKFDTKKLELTVKEVISAPLPPPTQKPLNSVSLLEAGCSDTCCASTSTWPCVVCRVSCVCVCVCCVVCDVCLCRTTKSRGMWAS